MKKCEKCVRSEENKKELERVFGFILDSVLCVFMILASMVAMVMSGFFMMTDMPILSDVAPYVLVMMFMNTIMFSYWYFKSFEKQKRNKQ